MIAHRAVRCSWSPAFLLDTDASSSKMQNLFHFPDLHRMRLRYIADVVIVVVVERSPSVALREVVAKSVHPFRKMSQSARRRLQSPMSWFCYSNELLSQFLTPSPAPSLMLWGNKERSIRTTKASQTEINKFSFARNFLHPAAVFFLQPLQRARGVIRSCNGNPFS